MTADQFAELVRSGSGSARVVNAVLHAGGRKIKGHGILKITREELELDFEATSKSGIPRLQNSLWNAEDFWWLTGAIEGDLPFVADRVSPGSRTGHFGIKNRSIQSLHLPKIELKPTAWDKLTDAQKRKAVGHRAKKLPRFPNVSFEAILIGSETPFRNARTTTTIQNAFLGKRNHSSAADTFIDRASDYDFALIKNDKDLEVHFRSKAGFRSRGKKDDRRRFQALLNAIGFTHGFQPWPFRISGWREGRKVSEEITAPRVLTKTIHAPFNGGLGRGLGDGKRGTRDSPTRIAARFFERERGLSKKLAYLLFLFREGAADTVDFRIQTLALCSLFEGIVNLLFEHLKLESKIRENDPHFNEYISQRDRLCSRLRRFSDKKNVALQRLAGSLEHARAFRVKDKFRALCNHFQLNYEEMRPHLDSWAARRHPLSHGEWDSKTEDFVHQSRIAGAINILVLKLMGFSGRMRAVTVGLDISETYRSI